jgi:hypothetical protein
MEDIWFRNASGLFTRENFLLFFPTVDMTTESKLNSLMRLTLYFTILCLLITNDIRMIYMILFMMAFTAMAYLYEQKEKNVKREMFEKNAWAWKRRTNEVCQRPTANNPFMNVLVSDLAENPERPPACDVENDAVRSLMTHYYYDNLFRDVDDIYASRASDHTFYTMPGTTIPNDRDSFAKWLYSTGKTCKEGNGTQCYANTYRPVTQ